MADIPGLVRYIATSMVDHPDKIEVSEYQKGRNQIVKLELDPGDMGRMIGRDGRIANAIRTMLKASTDDQSWGLEITSPEEEE